MSKIFGVFMIAIFGFLAMSPMVSAEALYTKEEANSIAKEAGKEMKEIPVLSKAMFWIVKKSAQVAIALGIIFSVVAILVAQNDSGKKKTLAVTIGWIWFSVFLLFISIHAVNFIYEAMQTLSTQD